MKFGIVICSRKKSSRIPEKPFQKIAGKQIINHLIDRLAPTGIPLVLAVPSNDLDDYLAATSSAKGVQVFVGDGHSPLHRMADAAEYLELDAVIRITHDKIFLEPKIILDAIESFKAGSCDYLYSSHLPDGAGFEIISRRLLDKAAAHYDVPVEHISYAVKSVNDGRAVNYMPDIDYVCKKPLRFLIDYPEDIKFLNALMNGDQDMTLLQAMIACQETPWFTKINAMPILTVYTCVYNAENTINRAIISALSQVMPGDYEYLIIDDKSNDNTLRNILYNGMPNPLRLIQNDSNIGLAASSNVALDNARGKYILRLDADDFFIRPDALAIQLHHIQTYGFDVCYPSYVCEKSKKIMPGNINHHAGGAIFDVKALRHLRFDESLRGYDGLDLFLRAKSQFSKIGYADDVIFFYSHSPEGMSHTNLDDRAKTKGKLLQMFKDKK